MNYERYSKVAMLLHWLLAFCLAFQIALGWRLEDLKGLAQFDGYQLHKSVGITILLLSVLRLGLRLTRKVPKSFTDDAWARRLAGAVHWGFYLVMIGAPITGWLIVSTSRIQVPTLIFGTIPWPHLPAPRGMHDAAESLHSGLAVMALVLFGLHIAGALRHQFIKREQLLPRMMPVPGGRLSMTGATIAVTLALLVLFSASSLGWFVPLGRSVQEAAAPATVSPKTLAPPISPEPANIMKTASNTVDAVEPSEASDWSVRPGGSLGFVAHWSGQPIKGSFGKWDADIRFGLDALEDSRIDVRIDLASVDTSDSQRDDSLRGGDFFDVSSHAQARFRAREIRHLGANRYRAAGRLDLHGVERPVVVQFTLSIKGDEATVQGSAKIARTDFAIGAGQWSATDAIADPVTIDFAFKADRDQD